MPYIPQERRDELEAQGLPNPETDGELNYLVTKLALKLLGEAPRYTDYNEVIGVLECAKLEFYIKKVRPYEEKKILENGDVF